MQNQHTDTQIFPNTHPKSIQQKASEEIYQLQRFSVGPSNPKKSRIRRNNTLGSQAKCQDTPNKIDNSIRLAAKGLRQPITGQLPTAKILQEYRYGPTHSNRKGVFFLCC